MRGIVLAFIQDGSALDVCPKQCSVIEIMCCENETVENIHKRLKKVYGDDAVDHSTVRSVGCRLFGQSGYANIQNFPCSCRQHIVLTPDNVQRINNLILADKRVTAKELSLHVEVGEATAHSPSFPSLHLHHSSFSNTSLALPTSQFVLQPFRCFSYVTGFSLKAPGEPPM